MTALATTEIRPFRLLLVDDDDLVARALARGLGSLGISVCVAFSASQAFAELTKLDALAFDAVLSDMNLAQPDRGDVLLAEVARIAPTLHRILYSALPLEPGGYAHAVLLKPCTARDIHDLLITLSAR